MYLIRILSIALLALIGCVTSQPNASETPVATATSPEPAPPRDDCPGGKAEGWGWAVMEGGGGCWRGGGHAPPWTLEELPFGCALVRSPGGYMIWTCPKKTPAECGANALPRQDDGACPKGTRATTKPTLAGCCVVSS